MTKRSSFIAASLCCLAAGAAAGAWIMHRYDARPERVVASFHKWYHAHGDQTYNNTRWMGTTVQKTPLDLFVLQEIISETQPDVIVEMGTYKGGSAAYYASLFDLMGHGRIITVDIEEYPNRPNHQRINYLIGSSTDPKTLERVKSMLHPGEKVMVLLDSDHHASHVAKELKLYAPLVTPGQYLVVEDTHFNGHPILPKHGPGPLEAAQEFLASNSQFRVDRSREKYGLTFNPGGYLKRQ